MEQAEQEPKKRSFRERFLRPIVIPALAVFTALLIGARVIIFTAENPLVSLEKVGVGYWGIIDGALLSTRGLTNTLVAMTPLILTGLAVAIPFRAGLFNIGGEGQFTIGALFGALAGIYLNLPPGIHVLVTLLAGFAGGMILGFIPGVLKAWLGSHEVINTIMLNYIALFVANMVVREFIRDPKPSTLQSLPLQESAWLPHLGSHT